MPRRVPGLLVKVNSEGWFTISQVAERCGKSTDTIRHWQETGRIRRPRKKMLFGGKGEFVWLYDELYIEDCIQIAATIRPGRPKKDEREGKRKKRSSRKKDSVRVVTMKVVNNGNEDK